MKIIKKFFLIFTLLVINHSTNAMQYENTIKNLTKELIEQFTTEKVDLISLIKNKKELKKQIIDKFVKGLEKSNFIKSNDLNKKLLEPIIGELINHLETIFIGNAETNDNFIKNLAKFIIQKSQEEKYAIIFGIASALLFLIITNKLDNYIPQGYTIIFVILACFFMQNKISKAITKTDDLYKKIEEIISQFLLDAIKSLYSINNK